MSSIYKALSHFYVIITTAGSNKVLSAAENVFSRAACGSYYLYFKGIYTVVIVFLD